MLLRARTRVPPQLFPVEDSLPVYVWLMMGVHTALMCQPVIQKPNAHLVHQPCAQAVLCSITNGASFDSCAGTLDSDEGAETRSVTEMAERLVVRALLVDIVLADTELDGCWLVDAVLPSNSLVDIPLANALAVGA